MPDWKTLLPIIISCLALVGSFASFYFSKLRSADVEIVPGEYVDIHFFTEGPVGITLPVTMVNLGASLATVMRLALLIQSPDSNEGYLFEPMQYQRYTENRDFVADSLPLPITVAGGSNVTKLVLFRSSLDHPKEFQLTKPGTYKMTVLGWIKDSVHPGAAISFFIVVSDADSEELMKRIQKPGSTFRTRQSQWRKWSAHRLTEVEVKTIVR